MPCSTKVVLHLHVQVCNVSLAGPVLLRTAGKATAMMEQAELRMAETSTIRFAGSYGLSVLLDVPSSQSKMHTLCMNRAGNNTALSTSIAADVPTKACSSLVSK